MKIAKGQRIKRNYEQKEKLMSGDVSLLIFLGVPHQLKKRKIVVKICIRQ